MRLDIVKNIRIVIGGLIGTICMTFVLTDTPIIEIPKIYPDKIISSIIGVSTNIALIIHYLLGIIFAFYYKYLLFPKLRFNNRILKGTLLGILLFIIPLIIILISKVLFQIEIIEKSMILIITGIFLAHIMYGIITIKIIDCKNGNCCSN